MSTDALPHVLTLCLVRHGITAPQQERRYCGHSDPPLSGEGFRQMHDLKNRLAGSLRPGTPAFTSDLRRAIESAEVLCPASITPLPELRELNFGAWEGQRFADTSCQDPKALRAPDFRFPGGEGLADLLGRTQAAWRRIIELTPGPPTAPVLVVAHAGSLAALTIILGGLAPEEFWNLQLPHAGVRWIDQEPS